MGAFMTVRRFQALAVAAFVLYSAWFFLPVLGWTITPESHEALKYFGAGGLPFTQHPFPSIALFAVRLVATLGLCLFFTWGRSLFAVWLGGGVIYGAMAGVLVSPPIDAAIGHLSSMVDVALLVLAYTSSAARFFSIEGAASQTEVTAPDP